MKKRKPRRPRRTLKQKLNRTIRTLRETVRALRETNEMLERLLATARRQFAETRSVNIHNAAAHRATEVAMLRQNHELQAIQAKLTGRPVHPELAAAAKEVPAMRLPKYLPVQDEPKLSPPSP